MTIHFPRYPPRLRASTKPADQMPMVKNLNTAFQMVMATPAVTVCK